VAADYTRTIVFKVEDKAIKRATDRITSSLQNIEKILTKIEQKGLKTFASSVEEASSGLDKATKNAAGLSKVLDTIDKKRGQLGSGIKKGLIGIADNPIPLFSAERAIARTAQTAIKRYIDDSNKVKEAWEAGKRPLMDMLGMLGNLADKIKLAKTKADEMVASLTNRTLRASLGELERELAEVQKINKEISIDSKHYRDTVQNVVHVEKQVNKELLARKRIYETITKDQIAFRNKIKRSITESRNRRAFSGSGFQEFSRRADQIKAVADEKRSPAYKALQEENRLKRQNDRQNARRDLQRTKGLAIEERINIVLKRRGRILAANGKIQKIQQNTMFKGGVKGAAGSAMIGGGFPLLFGQGGAGAAFGGIGGAIGGSFGGQFGFAGSIIATAIAQWIQGIDEFNLKLRGVNADMKALGFSSEFTGGEIKEMAKYLRISKDETMQLFSNYMRFGKEVGTTLMKFYGNDFSSLFAIGKIKDQQSAIQAIVSMSKVLTFQEQAQLLAQLGKTTAVEMQIKLSDLMIEKQYEKRKELIKEISLMGQIWYLTRKIIEMGADKSWEGKIAGESPVERRDRELRELNESMEENRLKTEQALTAIGSVEEAMNNLKLPTITGEIENLGKEIEKLMNPVFQLTQAADAIGNAFGESFKGIVSGSMTAQDALRNLFQRTADHFLDMAAQIMAAQIKAGIMGMFNFGANPLSALSSSTFPTDVGGLSFTDAVKLGGNYADGGRPPKGRASLVGERGPELFVPDSAGTIVPNHEMGGANIVVNVDASGSSVEGDAGQAEELGSMLAAAVQAEIVNQQRPGGLLAGTR
jgi:hypothetical protein